MAIILQERLGNTNASFEDTDPGERRLPSPLLGEDRP
jgi:hypothetical protein